MGHSGGVPGAGSIVIPDRAFDEARGWLAKARRTEAKALEDLEVSMSGYGMPAWAQAMLAEEIMALIRLQESRTGLAGCRKA